MRKIYLLLIMTVITATSGWSLPSDYLTGRLLDDNVPVSGDYTGFCQDKEGFIWIGTNCGLLRFDGNAYDIYRHEDKGKESLSDSRVLDVMCDTKGRVWVATANGLNLYKPETNTFQTIAIPSKTFYGYIIAIGEQVDGTVTFVVSGVGLYVISFNEDEPVAVNYTFKPASSTFNTIACCPNGQMYFGSHDGYVYKMDSNGRLTQIKVSEGAYIVSLRLESDGNVLVGTLNEIYRIDKDTQKVAQLRCEGRIKVNDLSNADHKKVYVATSDNGLWQVREGSGEIERATELYCPFVDLKSCNIGAVYSATDDNLWIGCNYKGIVMVPGERLPFTYKKVSDAYPDFGGGINAMQIWNERLLLALDKGRIGMYAPDGSLKMSSSLPTGGTVTSIELTDGDKALLGVSGEGVWELDLNSGVVKKKIDIVGKYPSVSLARGKGNEIWIGVQGIGLKRHNLTTGEGEWIAYDENNERGLSNPHITHLCRTKDDKVWIATYSGLACYNLKTNKMEEVDQLPFLNGTTYTVEPYGDGSVLAGTSQGLIHYDLKKGVIKKYTTADGLTDNDVRSIVVDKQGGMWIGTMRGLSYLPKGKKKMQAYFGGYGLVENTFCHALQSEKSGHIYLGSDLGMTSFNPASVPVPGFAQEIKISAFSVNGVRLEREAKNHVRGRMAGESVNPTDIWLPYKNNALTLRMSTMDYRDASNISYQWRLSSKDSWNELPPGENLIYLPHLDPGVYNFESRAVENNVISAVTKIKIHISSPWYLGLWAKILYAVIFIALVLLALTVYKKKQEEKIYDEKIKFFMDISHDLRSPITLIKSPLETLLKQPLDKEVKEKLQTMHRNVGRVLSLVNQLLDIRKLEKGKMHLYCRKTDMNKFVEELVTMFGQQAADKKLQLKFEEWENGHEVWIDRNNFDKVLVNIISNAIKYTSEGGEIKVKVAEEKDENLGDCVSVKVEDTGVGLDANTEAQLFERFFRVENDNSQRTLGFGIGLDLCRRLMYLHHGSITGKNRTDGVRGSVFEVRIPLDEKLYEEGELIEGEETDRGAIRRMLAADETSGETSNNTTIAAGKSIIFVDDDSEMRGYVGTYLSKLYKVRTASNGAEALKMVGEKKPDIIISDVMMPEVDGLTLLKRLKSGVETNDIPVIILSSKSSISDRISGWDKGADAYLGKPFNIEELGALVVTLIENRQRMKGKFSGAQETEGKITKPEVKGNDEMLMDRILKEINQYIDDPELNVEKLATEVGVSRTHLHRKMKEIIGMTPSDYIRNIRLRRASELLKRGDIEVTQVAYQIGFTSQSHFSSHFKRYTGYSPTEYQKKFANQEQKG